MNFYDFSAKKINGQNLNMSEYKGKVLVVVNTASKCGFTPQYGDLEKIYKKYNNQGLEIVGFPCNQFLEQEPGSNKDVTEFCKINYGVTFQLFEKIDVRGFSAHPIFKYLSEAAHFQGFNLNEPNGKFLNSMLKEKFPEYLIGNSIKWNFTKFLIDREGNVVGRFEPTVDPLDMVPKIEELL